MRLRCLAPAGNESFWSTFMTTSAMPSEPVAFSYRSSDAPSQGPYGYTVRDVLLHSKELGQVSYTQIPETVSDLLDHYRSVTDTDLTDTYQQSTYPVIVEFRHAPLEGSEIQAAFWYMYQVITSKDDGGCFTVGSYNGMGSAVPSADIISVE